MTMLLTVMFLTFSACSNDDDAVADAVAHDLHLVLFPALDGFLDERLACGRELKSLAHDEMKLIHVVRDATRRSSMKASMKEKPIPDLSCSGLVVYIGSIAFATFSIPAPSS